MSKHTLTGTIRSHPRFRSKLLGNRRDVLVYLPPGYSRFSRHSYPVFYLHDGQNVFDAATAFGGVEWGVDETAQRLIKAKLIEPLIIVAAANKGEERINEYAPSQGLYDEGRGQSKGLGRTYARFLIEELKPFIDRKYRTLRGPETTGLGGASLGGLTTLALGLWYPNVFQRLAVLSPSVWWDNLLICRMVDELDRKLPLKIWLDTGMREEGWDQARVLRDLLVNQGWRLDDDLQYLEVPDGEHSERCWGARVETVLRFLYPPQHVLPAPARRRIPFVRRREPAFSI
jgi:predicted alpha/beta superfamily hydrolase